MSLQPLNAIIKVRSCWAAGAYPILILLLVLVGGSHTLGAVCPVERRHIPASLAERGNQGGVNRPSG